MDYIGKDCLHLGGSYCEPEIYNIQFQRVVFQSKKTTERSYYGYYTRELYTVQGLDYVFGWFYAAPVCPGWNRIKRNGGDIMMQRFSFRFVLAAIITICLSSPFKTRAQIAESVKMRSTPNPVGSGARALGMGGAFIGVADDATAASWNPGGLIRLEYPEASIVGAYNHRTEDTTYEAFPKASGPQRDASLKLNYMSAAYPFSLIGRNMIVSLNYQHLYDFNSKMEFSNSFVDHPDELYFWEYENRQEGALYTISPAFAMQVTPKLWVGVALNFWEDGLYDNKWKNRTHDIYWSGSLSGDYYSETMDEETYRLTGFNYNFGILWKINRMFDLGAVFKAPFSADVRKEHYGYELVRKSDSFDPIIKNESKTTRDLTMDMPMSYGIGFAVRFGDALTLALDIYRTEWGSYVLHTEDGDALNPITGTPDKDVDVDATTQVRLGCEYIATTSKMKMDVPIRAGFFYDPEPAHGSPNVFWGVSAGGGLAYKNYIFDIAYQYRFGKDILLSPVGGKDAYQDVDQHTVYMSFIYHFL